MNIILGAGGQVGAQVAALLESREKSVRRVFHHAPKQGEYGEVAVADYFDVASLRKAFDGGSTALLLTPESMTSEDMLADAKRVFDNYVNALRGSSIKRIVALSSGGAQLTPGTGTLQLYALLEETARSLELESFIVRPAYYYSNWMMYLEAAQSDGVLPAFFPPELVIPMIAPRDVATFIADVMENGADQKISEITGPTSYSTNDIARFMSDALGRDVMAMQIPQGDWLPGLLQVGFSQSSAEYLLVMTEAVISGKTGFTMPPVYTKTSFAAYLKDCIEQH